LHHLADLIDLQEGGIGHAQLATNNRDTIDAFAARLVGQFQKVEPFRRQLKTGVDTPKPVRPLRVATSLGNRAAIENADQAALRRGWAFPRQKSGNQSR
jgi:hypothetical protein